MGTQVVEKGSCRLVSASGLPPGPLTSFPRPRREKDPAKEKEKKVKKTIPAWATLSASQLARAQKQTQMAASSRPKMDAILIEAIKVREGRIGGEGGTGRKDLLTLWLPQTDARGDLPTTSFSPSQACYQKGGASVVAIRKYIISRYPSLDLERRGYLLKQALKRELERGVIRQVSTGCPPATWGGVAFELEIRPALQGCWRL